MIINVHGHDAYCYTGGKTFNPELPTAVFIHGAQNDHSVWALQSRYFAHHGFSVLAVDLPGHGRSKGEALDKVEAMAGWLLALLDAASVKSAMLFGHSMGSLIALEACSLEASQKGNARVKKIGLIGTAYPMKVSDLLLNAARDDEQSAIDMVNIWQHSSIAQKPSCPGPGFYVMGASRRLMQRMSAINTKQLFFTDFTACNNYSNGEKAAANVQCPTLFVLAKNDMMTPPKASALISKIIIHSKTVMLDNCGHSMMSEQPDALLNALIAFART